MTPFDAINGVFEAGGAILVWNNFRRLRRDKLVRGVDWRVTAFFSAWGFWNAVAYYPSLHQWFSFAGGIALVAGNCAWLTLALKYRKN